MNAVRTAAELLERLVSGVLGAAAAESARDLLRLGGPEPQRGRVLDELVVLLGDELPADRARQGLVQTR